MRPRAPASAGSTIPLGRCPGDMRLFFWQDVTGSICGRARPLGPGHFDLDLPSDAKSVVGLDPRSARARFLVPEPLQRTKVSRVGQSTSGFPHATNLPTTQRPRVLEIPAGADS